jgi:hypothetical protein
MGGYVAAVIQHAFNVTQVIAMAVPSAILLQVLPIPTTPMVTATLPATLALMQLATFVTIAIQVAQPA